MANRFSFLDLGMFKNLKNENSNINGSRKNERRILAHKISWILIYNLCMVLVKWAGLYHFCGSLCPKNLGFANLGTSFLYLHLSNSFWYFPSFPISGKFSPNWLMCIWLVLTTLCVAFDSFQEFCWLDFCTLSCAQGNDGRSKIRFHPKATWPPEVIKRLYHAKPD